MEPSGNLPQVSVTSLSPGWGWSVRTAGRPSLNQVSLRSLPQSLYTSLYPSRVVSMQPPSEVLSEGQDEFWLVNSNCLLFEVHTGQYKWSPAGCQLNPTWRAWELKAPGFPGMRGPWEESARDVVGFSSTYPFSFLFSHIAVDWSTC